jgi:hypothetical protein
MHSSAHCIVADTVATVDLIIMYVCTVASLLASLRASSGLVLELVVVCVVWCCAVRCCGLD